MGLWDKIKGELIDVIQWLDPSNNTIVHRFERYGNEIKQNAKLTVRESQAAVFVNEGQIADVFKPGLYTLDTKNLPILSTLQGWKYGFESPFKAEVYFVNTKKFTDNKWGTKNPIMLRDPEFGPVRLRAFGTYVFRVKDPGAFVKYVSGTDGHFSTEEITEQFRNLINSRFPDALGEARIPMLDLAARYNEMGDLLGQKMQPDFDGYGVEVLNLLIENISLPPEVEKALDARSSMGIVGNLGAYTQFQAANAIPTAAANPGGLAAAGVGLGMGMAMMGQMGHAMGPAGGPPPLPAAAAFFAAVGGSRLGPLDMNALQQQIAGGMITRDTLVWKQGMANWAAAGTVPELAALFAAVPPPLPPPMP